MAALTDEQKLYVVQHLGSYHSPSEVADLLKSEYGVEAVTAQLARYNPLTSAGRSLSKPLKEAFFAARTAFLNDQESIAIAQQNFRLRELETLYRANKRRSPVVAASLLEQAARERGGMYSSHNATPAQVAALVAQMMDEFLAALKAHVQDPQQRALVAAELKTGLAAGGAAGGS